MSPRAASTATEKSIVNAILRYLNGLDRCYAHKVHGGAYGVAGQPDIDACLNGRALKIEVKRPGQDATPIQRVCIDRWRAAGAVSFVAHSVDEVKDQLRAAQVIERDNGLIQPPRGQAPVEPPCPVCGQPVDLIDVSMAHEPRHTSFLQGDCPNRCASKGLLGSVKAKE